MASSKVMAGRQSRSGRDEVPVWGRGRRDVGQGSVDSAGEIGSGGGGRDPREGAHSASRDVRGPG
jgi:hypothetical protein